MITSPPSRRKDKRTLSGKLTPRLIDSRTACDAIFDLARSTTSCTLIIKLPAFDYQTGNENDPEVILLDRDEILEQEEVTRNLLLKSRRIHLLTRFADDGIAIVNVTEREWTNLNDSKKTQ